MNVHKLSFYKFQATGNDFVIIDSRNPVVFSENMVADLCHRKTGIGADGFIFIEPSEQADFTMRYFNADGKEASLCGNGSRCAVAFANYLKMIDVLTVFQAVDGLHQAKILSRFQNHWQVELEMTDVRDIQKYNDGYFLDTGSPHFIQFVDNQENINIEMQGQKLRYDSRFEGGTNVNFVSEVKDGIFVSTYERGVEAETLSCGTGVTAAALAYAHVHPTDQTHFEIFIHTKGGILKVAFEKKNHSFTNIKLCGEATLVFQGEIEYLF
jgi:diaminopimelate epimerase